MLGGLGSIAGGRTPVLLGALALGYAHKEKWLEKLPVIGKAGPITSFGLLGWGAQKFLKVRLPDVVDKAVTAALAISAFNIGFSAGQSIVGDDEAYPGGAVVFD